MTGVRCNLGTIRLTTHWCLPLKEKSRCTQFSGETRTGSLSATVNSPTSRPTYLLTDLYNFGTIFTMHCFQGWALPNFPSKRSLIASTWLLWCSLLLCQDSFCLVHLITLCPMCSRTRWLWTFPLLLPVALTTDDEWCFQTLSIQPVSRLCLSWVVRVLT